MIRCINTIKQYYQGSASQKEMENWFYANVEFHFPNTYFWDAVIKVNLALKSSNSLLWLLEAQGYQKGDLFNVDNEFIESVRQEMINNKGKGCTLEFFLEITVSELCKIMQYGNGDNDIIILLPKNTHCGMIDHYTGIGSNLGIVLEKEVPIPISEIEYILPDGVLGYSARSLYSLELSFWNAHLEYKTK